MALLDPRERMKVGAEVQSLCRKCGESWHVVVALAGGQIAQVECGSCGARHRYRPAGKKAAASPRAARTGVRRGAPARPLVEADPSRPVRPFRVSDTYQVGDRVAHASFGEGVVQALKGPTKVEVHFADGARVLVHGRGS